MLRYRPLAVLATATLVALAARPGQAVETPDRDKLHKGLQGFWRPDAEKMAENVPGYKDGTPEQRQAILARMPAMVLEFTFSKMTRLAMTKEAKDDSVEYTIVGVEGNALRLSGKRPGGEAMPIVKVEVVDDTMLRMYQEGIPMVLILKRVKNRAGDPLE